MKFQQLNYHLRSSRLYHLTKNIMNRRKPSILKMYKHQPNIKAKIVLLYCHQNSQKRGDDTRTNAGTQNDHRNRSVSIVTNSTTRDKNRARHMSGRGRLPSALETSGTLLYTHHPICIDPSTFYITLNFDIITGKVGSIFAVISFHPH